MVYFDKMDKIPKVSNDPIYKLFSDINAEEVLEGTSTSGIETDPTKIALGEPISPLDITNLQAKAELPEPEINFGRVQFVATRETGPTLKFRSGPSISPTKMPS